MIRERTHRIPRRRQVEGNSVGSSSDQPEAPARVFVITLQGLMATLARDSGWYGPGRIAGKPIPAGRLNAVSWRPDPIFMIDVCESDGRFCLVELNGFSCSWLYQCDLPEVVGRASELAVRQWASSREGTETAVLSRDLARQAERLTR